MNSNRTIWRPANAERNCQLLVIALVLLGVGRSTPVVMAQIVPSPAGFPVRQMRRDSVAVGPEFGPGMGGFPTRLADQPVLSRLPLNSVTPLGTVPPNVGQQQPPVTMRVPSPPRWASNPEMVPTPAHGPQEVGPLPTTTPPPVVSESHFGDSMLLGASPISRYWSQPEGNRSVATSSFMPAITRFGPTPKTNYLEPPGMFLRLPRPARPSCCPPIEPDRSLSHPGKPLAQGEHGKAHVEHVAPTIDGCAKHATYYDEDFSAAPFMGHLPYDSHEELDVYYGKSSVPVQRPLVELGIPFYRNGPIPPSPNWFGETNPVLQKFYIYGDYRAAVAYNDNGGNGVGVKAHRLNLDWDYWLTSTERIHMFTGPFQEPGGFQRVVWDDGDIDVVNELDFWDPVTDTLFFEGDMGAILGGFFGTYPSFEMPFAVGLIPLLFQNGIWVEDAFVGAAVTIPARNSPRLDWSNFDITFFTGFDQVTSPAFGNGASANIFGVTTFIESQAGYLEVGYAFLDDRTAQGRSYHNVGISYTRRYLNRISNSIRVIGNAGQNAGSAAETAEGVLLLVENSLITSKPYNVIPYLNFFAGFGNPQSAARAGAAGGILRNTGLVFESDNLTGFPTLDATANDTVGFALGLDLLASPNFQQQLIVEGAFVQTISNDLRRNIPGNQYGLGLRFQQPFTNAHLLRFDAIYGVREDLGNVAGLRTEFRWKF